MTDLQGYATIMATFILSLTFLLSGKQVLSRALLQVFIWVLLIKTGYYTLKILLTPVDKGPMLKAALNFKYLPDVAYMGLFLGCLVAFMISRPRIRTFTEMLSSNFRTVEKLIMAAICTTYLLSALSAITNFKGWVMFFDSCGYSRAFLVLIITVETGGGIGVIFKSVRKAAVFILTADMAGATFTHFHNYFSKHVPDPLGNSLPSLAMLTILASLMILYSVHNVKKRYNPL
jgi:uncharacterized membrane protein YphA (DoxX/SURF4 family)